MQVERMDLFFHDEHDGIGCGLRRVDAQIGKKWVYLRLPYRENRVKMAVATFERIQQRTKRHLKGGIHAKKLSGVEGRRQS